MLIFLLLAMAVLGIGAVSYVENTQVLSRIRAGEAEATVLEALRNAANNMISENMSRIQEGLPVTKTTGLAPVTVTPVEVGGELVWEPTLTDLRNMGYLPSGWTLTTSNLNGQPYRVRFQRVQAGCVPINCNIEGSVVLMGPIRESAGNVDAVVTGAILSKLGVDGGVSLNRDPPGTPDFVRGRTWSTPNPLTGHPAGVVGVRVGTASSAFASFVRVGDLRDPDLQGGLTVRGGAVTVRNAPINVNNAAGTPCSTMRPDGVIELNCTGRLNAATGVFTTGVNVGDADPVNISVTAGDLFIRNAGGVLVQISATGDLTATGSLNANGHVSGRELQLTGLVNDGDPCATPNALTSLRTGGVAICGATGTYRALTQFGQNRGACTSEGGLGVDTNNREALICRGGQWAVASAMFSGAVLMGSYVVRHGGRVPMPECRDTGAALPEAHIVLTPGNEGIHIDRVVLRGAAEDYSRSGRTLQNGYFRGGEWIALLTDSNRELLEGSTSIAMIYCVYH